MSAVATLRVHHHDGRTDPLQEFEDAQGAAAALYRTDSTAVYAIVRLYPAAAKLPEDGDTILFRFRDTLQRKLWGRQRGSMIVGASAQVWSLLAMNEPDDGSIVLYLDARLEQCKAEVPPPKPPTDRDRSTDTVLEEQVSSP